MQDDLILTIKQQYLEACFTLPSHDYKIERVHREISGLFASEELKQRLREKGRKI
ncbi:MAG: hypothetical protein MUD14_03050 [Hydrococcus sp. Prado102]|jgi:hypothetical protein|nr:hypothetical protein [Hydrococcus sp. Prado102]